MNKTDFDNKSFDELIEQLYEEIDTITNYDVLKDFAIENIGNDNLYLAIHILEAIQHGDYYYDYDYSMGKLDTPTPLEFKADVIDYLED